MSRRFFPPLRLASSMLCALALAAAGVAQVTVFSANTGKARRAPANQAAGSASRVAHTPLLPVNFAGWRQAKAAAGADPAAVDAANAALLREYGFTDYETAAYARADAAVASDRAEPAAKLTLKAARFRDGTGAFGAFSFYTQPGMEAIEIGDRGVTNRTRVLFLRANLLVEADFTQPTSMSAAELRQLAQEMPVESDAGAAPPEVLADLPAQKMLPGTLRYVQGPVGLAAIGSPLPAAIVDFARSGELATADYQTRSGIARLVVVAYPTPQIAADRERALAASFDHAPASAPPRPAALAGTVLVNNDSGPILFRRSGPLLVYVSGAAGASEMRTLAESINYEATVTWSQPTPVTASAVVKLAVVSLVLSLMLIAIFLVSVIFFGGSYALLRKLFPRLRLPAPDRELIKLNLKE